MAAGRPTDKYTNMASAIAVEATPGTLKFTELQTGISLGQGVGIVIDQIDYWYSLSTLLDIIAAGDGLAMGWSASSAVPDFIETTGNAQVVDSRVIHSMQVRMDPVIGTPASNGRTASQPITYQFFPGMIVAAPRLYFGGQGNSLSGNGAYASRLYFRYVELTSQEYLELAESFILVG